MFDRLVDFLIQFLDLFRFFVVIPSYGDGVVLRFGKFHRLTHPGFHFIWPFKIEEVLSTNVVTETMPVGPQSLTTKDGVSIVISTVVTFRKTDVKTFLLEIEGAGQVIEDATYGIVAQFVMGHSWDELREGMDMANELTKAVRRQAKKYGVDIITVQISDFTRSRSYRLMQPMHGHGVPIHHS